MIFNPILNQKMEVTGSPKEKLIIKKGKCTASCTLNQDVVYPRDSLKLSVKVDNSACKKPVEKYICKLIRRVEYYNLIKKQKKPMYTNEKIIF